MKTWRDRLVSDSPLTTRTRAMLKAAWIETLGDLVDVGLSDPSLAELSAGQRMRITSVIAECRDDDIRRRFPPFGVAA